jgi:hypothetical protein
MSLKRLWFTALTLLLSTACGYHPAYAGGGGRRLTVAAASFRAPHPDALEAALAGVRAGLSEAGALEPGESFPKVVVELVRVDELPAGISSMPAGPESIPLARGSAVGVVARAWVLSGPGAAPISDTGDVRRVEQVAQGAESLSAGYAYAAAVRGAARRAGEALARRILGAAEPGSDPI